ncbi:MAG: pyridoxal-phosphate dependent enzyme [Pirellulaceae bacterium]|nr:pyridoxal-phosphate dependent enzyme [Pirellulaceae bacterium]
MWQWQDAFESVPEGARVSLGEGHTPLVRSRRLGPAAGLRHLLFKLEASNPSGSYKDRFASAAISHMRAAGQTHCLATSSGNTGAALAAYCAAAGIHCEIVIVETAPLAKLQQMLAYGADIYRVRGFGLDDEVTRAVFEQLDRRSQSPQAALQISAFKFSPLGMGGVRTLGHELVHQVESHARQLGCARLDHVFCPAGGGGLTLAVAEAFQQVATGRYDWPLPKVECAQPAGNDTIAGPLRDGAEQARAVACTTRISGLQVASVVDGHEVIRACRATGGSGHVVDDEEVWSVQRRLATEEGVFCEPAAAVSVAAALQAARQRRLDPSAVVCCLVTGSGFKDPAALDRLVADRQCPLIDVDQMPGRHTSP